MPSSPYPHVAVLPPLSPVTPLLPLPASPGCSQIPVRHAACLQPAGQPGIRFGILYLKPSTVIVLCLNFRMRFLHPNLDILEPQNIPVFFDSHAYRPHRAICSTMVWAITSLFLGCFHPLCRLTLSSWASSGFGRRWNRFWGSHGPSGAKEKTQKWGPKINAN